MRYLKEETQKINGGRLFMLSAIVTLIQFVIFYTKFPAMIAGDDCMADYALSGAYNGTIQTLYPFSNIILIRLISNFYKISDTFPFYSSFLILSNYISFTVIHYSFLRATNKKNYPLWVAEIVYIIYYLEYGLQFNLCISFTLVAGLCGYSAVCLILSSSFSEKNFNGKSCYAILLTLLGCFIRPESGYVPFCFLLLSYAFVVLKDCNLKNVRIKEKHSLSIIFFFALSLLSVLSITCIDKKLRDEPNAEFITKWNEARSVIVDFKGLSYEEDSDFLNSLGWNKEFFDLEETFYNLDDKCDYKYYAEIKKQAESKTNLSIISIISKTFATAGSLAKSTYYFPLYGIVLVVIIYCMYRIIKTGYRKSFLTIAFIFCAFGGTLIMWVYLCYIGRFVPHVFKLTLLGFVLSTFYAAIELAPTNTKSFSKNQNVIGSGVAVFSFLIPFITSVLQIKWVSENNEVNKLEFVFFTGVFFLVVLSAFSVYAGKNSIKKIIIRMSSCGIISACIILTMTLNVAADIATFKTRQNKFLEEQKYAATHTDEILVSARSFTPAYITSLYKYGNQFSNLFYCVDFLMYSDAYEEKLNVNRLEKLNIESYFTEENVYYIGQSENDSTLSKLLAYARTQYGDSVKAEEHEILDNGVSVFKFIRN